MAKSLNRRTFLGVSAAATAAGALSARSREEEILLAAVADGQAPAPPAPAPATGPAVPVGTIGNVKLSRLIMGGNLIGGWAHSRDLIYVSRLLKAYNSEEKIFETLHLAEQNGVDTILVNPGYLQVVKDYNQRYSARIQVISEIHVDPGADAAAIRAETRRLLSLGANLIYIQGMKGDNLVRQNRVDTIAKTMEVVKSEGVPAGVGGHTLAVVEACEREHVPADFYVKTFHHARYWSGSKPESRKEWFEEGYADNVWCTDADKVRDVMAKVEKPWIAFKVLAAGAIDPRDGFGYAFANGADFICVGMFDFQVAEDAKIATRAVADAQQRPRPWRG